MDTKTNVTRLMRFDSLIKKGLSDEIIIIKSIYLELIDGLKQIKESIAPVNFEEEKETKSIKKAITAFIKELYPLTLLEGRFHELQEGAVALKAKLDGYVETLSIYNSSKKAMIDFENNIIYEFKITIQRKFENEVKFNEKMENALL